MSTAPKSSPEKRIYWTDGCFDMFHWAHSNALRQAKSLCDYLVVGVHSDAEVEKHKGAPPVMKEEERYAAVAGCKWVDEVVKDAPYITSLAVMDQHNCSHCVHGDDIVIAANGKDTYWEVKEKDRFVTVPRTEGISTTQLVGRMLRMTTDHHHPAQSRDPLHGVEPKSLIKMTDGAKPGASPYTGVSHYLPSTRKIVQFSSGREPSPTDKVVYIDGAFDLFHCGHVETLKKARELGDYLLVGVYADSVINQQKGSNWPIMNVHERVLSVLACRHVDEVIIGAPWELTDEMIRTNRISVVVGGTVRDAGPLESQEQVAIHHSLPIQMGIFTRVNSNNHLTATEILSRVLENRQKYAARNVKKEAQEAELVKQNTAPLVKQSTAPALL